MEATTCVHDEKIEEKGDGIQEGTCSLCRQVRCYDLNDTREKCRVIKLGRLDDKIVIPNLGERLNLSDEEREELTEALAEAKEPLPVPVQEPVESAAERKPPRRTRNRRKFRKYYEQNKAAIIADYYSLRLKDFFRKWRFATSTWTKLKTEWEVKPKGPPLKRPRKPKGEIPVVSVSTQSDQLPQFPPFNDKWTSDVQIAWLETYKALRLGKEVSHDCGRA